MGIIKYINIMSSTVTVCITGAAGQIAYSLIPMVCNGQIFGMETHINLHLLDIKMAINALEGVVYEIEDCKYKLINDIK